MSVLLSAMTLSIVAFAMSLVMAKYARNQTIPFIGCLLCSMFFSLGGVVLGQEDLVTQIYISLLPLAFYTFSPFLWLYHQAITSEVPFVFSKSEIRHWWFVLPLSIYAVLLLALPRSDFQALFFGEVSADKAYLEWYALTFFVVLIGWLISSIVYLKRIWNNTIRYRRYLKVLFSDVSGRSLYWIEWLTLLILLMWGYSLTVLFFEQSHYLLSSTGVSLLLFVFSWLFARWGVQQQPLSNYVPKNLETIDQTPATEFSESKYERSALTEEDANRIATKIERVVIEERLFLDSDLSLFKLSERLGVSTQYLSQTFSQNLKTTFFDYVNRARVSVAKDRLLNSDSSVLDVAMEAGFNARSSFYKAFKQETSMTPSEFKQANMNKNKLN